MKKQISIGAFISYFTIGINVVIGLLYTPWMVHTIGDSNYALYTLALSVIGIFMADFGLSSATSRFLSNYYANGEKENADRFMGITLKLYLLIDVVIFVVLLVLFFFIERIYIRLTPEEIQTFKVLYCVVAFYSIISFPLMNLNGVLIAKEKFISVKLCGLFQKLLTVFFVVCALLSGGNVFALVLANAVSGILFSVIKLFLIKKSGVRFNLHYRNREIQKELIIFSIWTTIVQIMQRFVFSLAPTLLAMYVNSVEIAYFSLASTIEGYVWTIGDAINGMFMPQIARLDKEEDADEKITNLMCRVGKFQIMIIGVVVVTFGLIGKDFVTVWMGRGYEKVAVCATLIIIPALIDIPQQVGKTTMLVRNKVKLEAAVYMLMVVIYLPLALVLTRMYGVTGTAAAILIVYVIRSATMAILYKIKLSLNMKKYFQSVYVRWIAVCAVCVLISKLLLECIVVEGLKGLIWKCAVCIVSYGIAGWFIFLDAEHRKTVWNQLHIKK